MTASLTTQWCALVLRRFAQHGVRHVVCSPGSRNTAMLLAAERTAGLQVHDVIDERAAGFFALGIARITGQPTVVLCTSGSAPAHYSPAVIEADLVGSPLIVVSADRPLELMDCRAPQAIDQQHLFGRRVRWFADLGTPDPDERAIRAAARKVEQAVLHTHWPDPGPVHVNVRFRKPFEPEPPRTETEQRVEAQVAVLSGRPTVVVTPTRTFTDLEPMLDRLRRAKRGIVLVGPMVGLDAERSTAITRFVARTRFPLLAESTGQLRRPGSPMLVERFDLLLRSKVFRDGHRPDLVVQIGPPPTSGSVEPWLGRGGHDHIVVAERGWNDWMGIATDLVLGPITAALDALDGMEWSTDADDTWLPRWRRAADVLDEVVASHDDDAECSALKRLFEGVDAPAFAVVANSTTVRAVDWFAAAVDIDIIGQRGANGIDGTIAGAAGAVTASGRPCVVILGDVAALHDWMGLLLCRDLPAPLVVVVMDNGGGGIFDLLPITRHPAVEPHEVRHLTTPTRFGWRSGVEAFGLDFVAVSARDTFEAVRTALRVPRTTVIAVDLNRSADIRATLEHLIQRFERRYDVEA